MWQDVYRSTPLPLGEGLGVRALSFSKVQQYCLYTSSYDRIFAMRKFSWLIFIPFAFYLGLFGCSGPGDPGNTPSPDTTSIIIGGGDTTPTVEAPTSSQPSITIYPTIINQNNDAITNLDDTNFFVTIQPVTSAGSYECTIKVTPHNETTGGNISLCMTLDKSGSMAEGDMTSLKTAAKTFIDLMKTDDELGIVSFSSTPEVMFALAATTASAKINMKSVVDSLAVDTVNPATALYDSMRTAIDQVVLLSTKERKALIAMTDGVDTNSKIYTTTSEVISYAILKNVQICTVGLGSKVSPAVLQVIASQTGGIYYNAASSSNLSDVYTNISKALRSYYTIEIIVPPEISPLTPGQTYKISLWIQNYGNIPGSYTFYITV